MQIPKILPDELLESYLIRLARLNNKTNRLLFLQSLLAELGSNGKKSSNIEALQILAAANEITPEKLLCEHTLQGALLSPLGIAPNPPPQLSYSLRAQHFCDDFARTDSWMCMQCAKQDLETQYFSTWRRSHQIPGIYECLIHETALLNFRIHSTLSHLPLEVLGEPRFSPLPQWSENRGSVVIAAGTFMLHILTNENNLNPNHCRDTLRRKWDEKGLSLERSSGHIRAEIGNLYDYDWFRWSMGDGEFRSKNFRFSPIAELITNKAPKTRLISVAILASLTFSTANDALAALLQPK